MVACLAMALWPLLDERVRQRRATLVRVAAMASAGVITSVVGRADPAPLLLAFSVYGAAAVVLVALGWPARRPQSSP